MQRRKVVLGVVAVAAIAAGSLIAASVTNEAADRQVAERDQSRARNVSRTLGDVDGDGRTDLMVYRPATATFWVDRSTKGELTAQLGRTGDRPAAGDFDGDGRVDLVAVRAGVDDGSSTWRIRSSGTGARRSISFGLAGDLAVPADYDGDGIDDIAVFRPGAEDGGGSGRSNPGRWYVRRSSDKITTAISFGLAGDLPVPADYDGDGTADLAVQRGGTRWILESQSKRTVARRFGKAGDVPVAINRARRGPVDLAVVRIDGATQNWLIQRPDTTAYRSIEFGRSGAPYQQRLVGDFDGDQRTEPAVFDSSTSAFWIWQRGTVRVVPWGAEGDVVVPLGVHPTAGLVLPGDGVTDDEPGG